MLAQWCKYDVNLGLYIYIIFAFVVIYDSKTMFASTANVIKHNVTVNLNTFAPDFLLMQNTKFYLDLLKFHSGSKDHSSWLTFALKVKSERI